VLKIEQKLVLKFSLCMTFSQQCWRVNSNSSPKK